MKNNEKRGRFIWLAALMLCGCAKGGAQEEAMSVEEELKATTVSEAIPQEAFAYQDIEFEVPKDFRSSDKNTEESSVWFSTQAKDHSFIAFTKRELNGSTTVRTMNEERLLQQLQAMEGVGSPEVEKVEVTLEEDGTVRMQADYSYEKDEHILHLKQLSFETGKTVFTIVYARDENSDWEQAFEESIATIQPVNLVNINALSENTAEDGVRDNETVSADSSGEGVDGEGESGADAVSADRSENGR